MSSQETRRRFLQYFKKQGHTIIPSSPVIPHDDPTILFTNAGMNQFKDVFLGKSKRDYVRATTSQKCIRAGGKHNDLENVGHTKRHLTFFEMLGNFSFGEYFKKEALRFGWEVSTEIFGFDPEKIWISVFEKDEEAFEIAKTFIPEKHIVRMGAADNFWEMGETGPCGPCSEFYYDRGGMAGPSPDKDPSGKRFLEFWNHVFMQFNRNPDGSTTPLPKPSIDTGAGLERVVTLQQGVDSVFDTDILRSLIAQVEEVSGKRYEGDTAPFRVIADHLRCLAFAIADGAQPSNVERGYVLRKILRRATRYGRQLGLNRPFLADVLPRLVSDMGEDYPELIKSENKIAEVITAEEEAFLRTLQRGGNILSQIMESAKKHGAKISGDDAFKLKDTYGLPLDEIQLLAKDAHLSVDLARYEELEKEAKERSRSTAKVTRQAVSENLFQEFLEQEGPTKFVGYDNVKCDGTITAIVKNGTFVDTLHAGEEGEVLLDTTCFYAEMGGQVGDTGHLIREDAVFHVCQCQHPFKGIISHIGTLERGTLYVGETLDAEVDVAKRQKIANNHTATHLLHYALHKVLGEHARQQGSVVEPGRLRFDFSHHKALEPSALREIEDIVNSKIRENKLVSCYEIPYDKAQKDASIKQFFGDKYGSLVRVVDIDYSKELCGGTHTSKTGNIGYFRIAKESSIAAGIRRIEAVTGEEAEALARGSEDILLSLAEKLKVSPHKLHEKMDRLLEEHAEAQKLGKLAKKGQTENLVKGLLTKVEVIKEARVLIAELQNGEDLGGVADLAMAGLKEGVVALGSAGEDTCQIVIRVSDNLVQTGIKAGDLIKAIAPLIEGGGGGKPHAAQAGGKAPKNLAAALQKCKELLQNA